MAYFTLFTVLPNILQVVKFKIVDLVLLLLK